MAMASYLAPASPFDAPSLLYVLLTQPWKLALHLLSYFFSLLRTQPNYGHPSVRLVCISDTHCQRPQHLPAGDVLIHAGDLTNRGTLEEIQVQIDWLDSLPYEHIIVIAGNHDTWLDPRSRKTLSTTASSGSSSSQPSDNLHSHGKTPESLDWRSIHYLQHSSITLSISSSESSPSPSSTHSRSSSPPPTSRTLKFYGAPQIPACGGDDFAFQYPRGVDAWSDTVPLDTQVLITHTPPRHHLDLFAELGCEFLRRQLPRVKPRVHVFGHVHAGKTDLIGGRLRGGREVVFWDQGQGCLEIALNRSNGLLRPLLDPIFWLNGLQFVVYGIIAVVWERGWGGSSVRSTVMVNAAMVYNNTGELGHPAQVVDV